MHWSGGDSKGAVSARLGSTTTHFRGWIPLGVVLRVLMEKRCSFFLTAIRILSCCLQAHPSLVAFEPSSASL